ncbi:MAG TPA: hypothetical protein EYP56_09590 [Planctomycetaceae bacterium]|nr:hypothetical protein [Planctomycetaceae bacterium]
MESGAMVRLPIVLVPVAVLAVTAAWGGEPLFPFVVSYETPDNATNISGWLDAPAGKHGFVRVVDGHLATGAGPVRFWATNLCFEACFPSHEQAERVAARLARFGFNCVRMHHMDAYSIWGDSPDKTTIDPKKLDRLDYLIYQLKRRGIYTNINLHVSRTLGDREGFPHADQRPKYDKGLGNFEPRMIGLQRKYARDLLTHVNPYTGTDYAHEPAVAFVEISNEDALCTVWSRGQLDELPDPYRTTFRRLWNRWLQNKYGSTERLKQAWRVRHEPLGGEMLRNGDFTRPLAGTWSLERDAQTEVTWAVLPGGPDGRRMLQIAVTRRGQVSWHPQVHQAGLRLRQGRPYTLTVWLRSDKPRRIGINCMMAHQPWEGLGLWASPEVGPQWRRYRFTFVAEKSDENGRITFTSLEPATYQLAGVSLRPGGNVGLEPEQRLEDDSIPVPRRSRLDLTEPARADWADFLWETERDYWWGMYRFLKDELDVQSLVSGTQLSYSPVHIQAGLDYIDAHSYWNHPVFPGRPWDPENWYVRNRALVNTPGGTLAGLAARRVVGMAFTVSEYNHPAPNVYAAEGFPMIAVFGAFQGWDGIFLFTYSHNTDFQPRRITGFFDIKSDPSRLVHLPACAALFLRGDAQPARRTLRVLLTQDEERNKLRETLDPWQLTARHLGADPRLALQHALALALAGRATPLPEGAEDAARFVSDTGQLRWDVSEKGAGYFIADTPRCKLFTGFLRRRLFQLGDVTLRIGPTRLDWATVSMVALDGESFRDSGRILIAATGWVQNTGATLQQLGEDRVTLGRRWGEEPVLAEGIPAEITLPVAAERVRFYPLDEAGNRRRRVRCESDGSHTVLTLDPKHQTLWYEVEIR